MLHKGVRHQAIFFTCSSSSVVAFAVHDCPALRLENGIAHRRVCSRITGSSENGCSRGSGRPLVGRASHLLSSPSPTSWTARSIGRLSTGRSSSFASAAPTPLFRHASAARCAIPVARVKGSRAERRHPHAMHLSPLYLFVSSFLRHPPAPEPGSLIKGALPDCGFIHGAFNSKLDQPCARVHVCIYI